MGITQLKNGKFRLQIRRKGFPSVDKVFESAEEAQAAETAAAKKQKPVQDGITLSELWERYHDSREFSEKAENTQKTERCRIKPVLEKLGEYSLENLAQDTSAIYDYMDKRSKEVSPRTKAKISGSTVRLEVAALSALVAFAKTRKLVRENFVTNISRPATKKRRRRVPPPELGKVQVFARSADPDIAKAARFVAAVRHLGCRPGELKKLLIEDLRLEQRELTFRDTKYGTYRNVHITSDAEQMLHLQLADTPDDSAFVFCTRARTGAWVPYNYAHGIDLLKEKSIVGPDFHMHAGRREFISRAIESNVPYATIRKQTGHKSTQALEIYDEGLSTAPGIRAELDRLGEKVQQESLLGALEALCTTDEQRQQVREMLGEDKNWVSFDDMKKRKSER